MVRTKHAVATRKRKKRLMKRAEGYWGGRHRLYRTARETVLRADQYAYRDRRRRKRDFRRLWITRLSAALQPHGINYSTFIHGVNRLAAEGGTAWNRKTLSELAIHDPDAFAAVVAKVKEILG
ncbi:MAG: 50S ribosomal protein L20 [Planctomycetota bacterium]|nr:MAG: 50S ribosomal protein L20 [Planctomycetota bacterium]